MIHLSRPTINYKEVIAVAQVMKSGNLAQGKEVMKFEEEFSKVVGGRNCIAVNSGTSGLHLSLLSAGIGPGDEVIVPSFSFAATANSIALTGAKPIFVDVNTSTFNIDPIAIESAITPRTKAIQAVHLYGLAADMVKIPEIAKKNNLLLFEDAAQAHLASFNGKKVGEFGEFATFSFYPTKNMTSGEGGMIVCKDQAKSRICRLLRNQGMEKKYVNEIYGFNNRMTDIQASIGRIQLRKLRKNTDKRQNNASFYSANLSNVITPFVPDGYEHVFHQYTIKLGGLDRDKFCDFMRNNGIETGVYYPIPIHELPSFNQKIDLPTTSKLCKEVVSIPIGPHLKQSELEKVVESINKFAKAGS